MNKTANIVKNPSVIGQYIRGVIEEATSNRNVYQLAFVKEENGGWYIDDVTDPTNNSINEKCARIRRAFVSALGNVKAVDFYIAGPRGGEKKITLNRSLMIQS